MSSLEWLTEHWQEGLDVVGVVATVVAAVLAWLAILRGNRQARAAAAALVRERRINFELEHLDRMGEALEKGPSVAFTVETIQRGLRHDIPILIHHPTCRNPGSGLSSHLWESQRHSGSPKTPVPNWLSGA